MHCSMRQQHVSIRQHTSAYVSIRQHEEQVVVQGVLEVLDDALQRASAIRQHTGRIRQHTSAYVSIRQHTSAYVSMKSKLW